jgi:hypothetical protein
VDDCGQRQQVQASKESTELTGIAEICRFRIWSSTKNSTKIRSDINDAIVFQVDQLGFTVSGIKLQDATTDELTASSVVLYQPSASTYDYATARGHSLDHHVRVQTHMLARRVRMHIIISSSLELGLYSRLETRFTQYRAASDWHNSERSASRHATDEIWHGDIYSNGQSWRGFRKARHFSLFAI